MAEEITKEQLQDAIRAEFEPLAIGWLADIKAAASIELPKATQDAIVLKLCEAYITGLEQGAEPTSKFIS